MMLLYAHSGIRYLAVLAGLAVVIYAFMGMVGRRPYDPRMRVLSGVYAMFLHLNVLLGLALLFTRPFAPYLIGHAPAPSRGADLAPPPGLRRREPGTHRRGPGGDRRSALREPVLLTPVREAQAPLTGARL